MALIAAASINIDWAMFFAFVALFVLIFACVGLCLMARNAVRRVCMNDDVDRSATPVATRMFYRGHPNSRKA